MIALTDCPKFDACSAPICPLDVDVLLRAHLPGERVCFYLRELSKPDGRAILRGSVPGEMLEAIDRATPAIIARHGPVRRALERASRTPSTLANLPRQKVTP